MQPEALVPVTAAVALGFGALILGLVLLVRREHLTLAKGRALIVTSARGSQVSFQGRLVVPIVQRAELMDITTKIVEVDRRGRQGLICRDNIRVDVKARFFVRVTPTVESVLAVAMSLGCERASDPGTLRELFEGKFAEGLKTVARAHDFEALISARPSFRDDVLCEIGADLAGFQLDDLVLDELEQTPLDQLDPNNILDAQGIDKIQRTRSQYAPGA